MKKVIVIVGPTGVGKTSIAFKLAKLLKRTLINSDLYQMYKGFDIGTGKQVDKEVDTVFFDILEPEQKYSIYHYQKQCRKVIDQSCSPPILVGGSFLYSASVIYDYQFVDNVEQFSFEGKDNNELYEELKRLDPQAVEYIQINNRKRLERALSICYSGGKKENESRKNSPIYDALIINLVLDKTLLLNRASQRFLKMIEDGFIQEVKLLKEKGWNNTQPFNAIGYKEIDAYLDGNITFEEVKIQVNKRLKQYIKRQFTYINGQFRNKIDVDVSNLEEAIKVIKEIICRWENGL